MRWLKSEITLQTSLRVGGLMGLGVALITAFGSLHAPQNVENDVVATVNDQPISAAYYQRAVEALGTDKHNPLSAADRRHVLDRLIDEELLVQHGIDLGLAKSSLPVRKALVDVMLQFAVAKTADSEPSDVELQQFYQQRPMLFASEPQLDVIAVAFANPAETGVSALRHALARGEEFLPAALAAGASQLPVPDGYSSLRKLVDYAGPAVATAADHLKPGQISPPILVGDRHILVWLRGRQEGPRPPFASVRNALREEWHRQRRDAALGVYLADLRKSGRVVISPRFQP